MKNKDNKKIHRTMIGGQAVIEGVMMRGVDKTALAVRKPDGSINLDVWNTSRHDQNSVLRLPLIRGVINFVEMLIFGYKTISRSAEIAELTSDDTPAEDNPGKSDENGNSVLEAVPSASTPGQPSDTESAVIETTTLDDSVKTNPAESTPSKSSDTDSKNESDGDKAMSAATAFSMIAGLIIAILLFAVLPTLIVGKTDRFVHWGSMSTIAEGVIKIAIFIGYLALIARMEDIQRVYQYHGAEHKTIYCYEHGDELTPENARKYVRFHPRCGTSFLLIVLIISIIVFSFVTWKTLWLRILLKLLLLPLVVGISYEIIKFAGRHDNSVMRFLLAPGLWLQRLTTREPDDSQLEVAIKALKAVIPDNPEDDLW